MTGKIFGFWEVIGLSSIKTKRRAWACQCRCGVIKDVREEHLRSGKSKSCGCMRNHGMSQMLLYKKWKSMRGRCNNVRSHAYHRYGGIGISVCERWNTFENFLEDMGFAPNGCTIDRIDNTKGYGPENCRWATPTEQARNRKNNRILTVNGESHSIAEWAEKMNISSHVFYLRARRGWSDEDIVLTPVRKIKKRAA